MIMRDTVVKVDLGAIRENMRLIAGSCGSDVAHNAGGKSKRLRPWGCGHSTGTYGRGGSVSCGGNLTEALELKDHYPDYPVFILGHTPERLCSMVVENDITQAVVNLRQAKALGEAAAKAGKKAKVHLKVDTGFHRLGIYDEEELYQMYSLPGLEVEGIFSHLALTSEEEDEKQYSLFTDMIEKLELPWLQVQIQAHSRQHFTDGISSVQDEHGQAGSCSSMD